MRVGIGVGVALVAGWLAGGAVAQTPGDEAVRAYVKAHQRAIVAEYLAYVAVPDLHGDLPSLGRNADLLMTMLAKRGVRAELWKTTGAPVVYGEKMVAGATRTVLFYIHYDGQPVDAKRWAQPDPFVPVMRTDSIEHGGKIVTDVAGASEFPDAWRVYARAAGDDKVPIEALLCALDALGDKQKTNVKIFLHGEEEGSGPSQAEVIKAYPDKLKADLLVILDGPQHPSGRPTIYYGARGGANLEVTVYTAKTGMHSGNYGNWMPDANVRLSQLIASMVEPTGKVRVAGFYDDVSFSKSAKTMMDAVPDNTAEMRKEFGIGSVDGYAANLQEGLNLPSFSVHQMRGGEAGGVIAGSATAEIAMRLVKENDPKTMVNRVVDHIKAEGYFVVNKDPDVATLASHAKVAKVTSRTLSGAGGSGAWRTDPEEAQAVWITGAMEATWPGKVVRVRTLGGSVPATPFIDAFHVPTVGISLANYDDNQHTDNENLRLGNLYEGVVTLAGVLSYSGKP